MTRRDLDRRARQRLEQAPVAERDVPAPRPPGRTGVPRDPVAGQLDLLAELQDVVPES
ncbi:hypothetical protein [Amycolatopsis sp. lyj-23]|uniref:hypothetical protein n=1 Tax=Amycolatopsis sp. lyj-23 TaxID=2789283 RepID=UPI00397D4F73